MAAVWKRGGTSGEGKFITGLCGPKIQNSVGIGIPLAAQRNKGMTRLDFLGTCKGGNKQRTCASPVLLIAPAKVEMSVSG